MRLLIKFSKNTSPVEIKNQHLVNNYIYSKCLKGDTYYHNAKNNYCISHLYGGKLNTQTKTLNFPTGGFIAITTQDENLINKIIKGVKENLDFICGMKFIDFVFINETFFDGWNWFGTLSPFIIKEYYSKKEYKYVVFKDEKFLNKKTEDTLKKLVVLPTEQFSKYVENHLKNKLKKVFPDIKNIDDIDDIKIQIKDHNSHKIKTIFKKTNFNNDKFVEIFANQCQVNVFCKKHIAEKIYNLGIGCSNGSGFGSLFKTTNCDYMKN